MDFYPQLASACGCRCEPLLIRYSHGGKEEEPKRLVLFRRLYRASRLLARSGVFGKIKERRALPNHSHTITINYKRPNDLLLFQIII